MQANEAVNRALIEIKTQPTTPQKVSIEASEKLFQFNTLNDAPLIGMLSAAQNMYDEFMANKPPRWLTLCGPSGIGKTHLAKRLTRMARKSGKFKMTCEDEFSYGVEFQYWPEVASDLQKGIEPEGYYHARRMKFLVLDDIGAIRDNTGHITSKLAELLGMRTERWTVITTNLDLEAIEKTIDARIASRVIRGKNVVIDAHTIDYAKRRLR